MRAFFILLAVLFTALPAAALQKFTVAPDGFVRFEAATDGITRLSVKGDRIRKIVNAETRFEMSNDSETGDVFLKHLGGEVEPETGYIVTEKGITLSYELTPVERGSESILISIEGDETEEASKFRASTAGGFSDPVAATLTGFVREVITSKIGTKQAPKRKNGARVSSYKRDGYRANILVARASKGGRLVRAQDFYRDGVLAIWVDKSSLAPGEASWVVVVTRGTTQ